MFWDINLGWMETNVIIMYISPKEIHEINNIYIYIYICMYNNLYCKKLYIYKKKLLDPY